MYGITLHVLYVVDSKGRRRAVQLPWKEYRRLLAILEDAIDLRVAKKRLKESRIPFA